MAVGILAVPSLLWVVLLVGTVLGRRGVAATASVVGHCSLSGWRRMPAHCLEGGGVVVVACRRVAECVAWGAVSGIAIGMRVEGSRWGTGGCSVGSCPWRRPWCQGFGLGSGGGGLWQVGRQLLLVGPGPTWKNHCPDGAEREWQCDAGVLAWFSHVAAAVL